MILHHITLLSYIYTPFLFAGAWILRQRLRVFAAAILAGWLISWKTCLKPINNDDNWG